MLYFYQFMPYQQYDGIHLTQQFSSSCRIISIKLLVSQNPVCTVARNFKFILWNSQCVINELLLLLVIASPWRKVVIFLQWLITIVKRHHSTYQWIVVFFSNVSYSILRNQYKYNQLCAYVYNKVQLYSCSQNLLFITSTVCDL